ncbi:phosphopantetheine-binding protein [Parahaliea aestuarii]|uniref:Acyl carrier protein n=1 Tax=Parahaliea aestuarii TaxID=1852021 RepID=A0A5C8ZQ30_9GAMM|nr:phosphopantetheine-binding protein [Parahaliea aestuarii]TXS90445.1 acyl carrier protein [Parahaliea aestuarii]
MSNLENDIKQLIIDALELEEMSTADIATDEPLFEDGLGLDSIDALELGMALQQRYNINLDAEDKSTREHFRSVASLAAFVRSEGAAA